MGRPGVGGGYGGCGGNSAAPEPKRSPAALLGQSRSQQKSFLFLLEEKIGARKIKKSEENFFAGWRALASGGGAERVSFAQSRFGFCHIIPHAVNISQVTPIGVAWENCRRVRHRFS
jgi:hypothetical protein